MLADGGFVGGVGEQGSAAAAVVAVAELVVVNCADANLDLVVDDRRHVALVS